MTGQKQGTLLQKVTYHNYIARDHLVHGIRVLPGVTLLDMIYRLSGEFLGTQAIELRQILFKQPVAVSETFDKNVSVTFTPEKSHWKVAITSQKVKNGVPVSHVIDENMECQLFLKEAAPPAGKFNIAAFVESAELRWDMDDIYFLARNMEIKHFVFMKTLGSVYQRNNEELMILHLSELAEKFRDKFYAHPAFLDGSTLAGSSFQLSGKESHMVYNDTPYIPFTIQRFCVYQPLPERIYTYSQNKVSAIQIMSGAPDLISTDITIYNESGETLVEFEKLVFKRIREPHLIEKLIEKQPAPVKTGAIQTPAVSQNLESKRVESPKSDSSKGNSRDIISFLQNEIGKILQKSPGQIDVYEGFYDLGLDSTQLLGLVKRLEQKLNEQLYPTLLFEYSNIQRLSEHLLENYHKDLSDSNPPFADETEKNSLVVTEIENEGGVTGLLLEPVWQKCDIAVDQNLNIHPDHIIILFDYSETIPALFQSDFNKAVVLSLHSEESSLPFQLGEKFRQLLEIIQKQLRQNKSKELLVQVVADSDHDGIFANMYGGLLKTVYLESRKIYSQIINIDGLGSQPAQTILQLLRDEAEGYTPGVAEIHYRGERLERYIKLFRELKTEFPGPGLKTEFSSPGQPSVFRENGVYVITGGLGGLGLLIADHIAGRAKVKLALIGRSKPNPEKIRKIEQLKQKGAEILCLEADISLETEARKAFDDIKNIFGPVNGIFHSAGVLNDQYIIQKDPADITAVFAPKIQGLWNIDEITRDETLDFFIMFSSVAAVLGNPGQADYASANAFMDVFAGIRTQKVTQNQRFGRTISINWPLWAEGGMRVNSEFEQMMFESTGMKALPTGFGLEVLDRLLAQNITQSVVLYGAELKIRNYIQSYLGSEPKGSENRKSGSSLMNVKISSPEDTNITYKADDIVIIGVSGRYPLADTIDQYYQNLRAGKDCITGFPKDRWQDYQFSYEIEQIYKYGGFIDRIDQFDPLFFNISPVQAEMMDPQARLFLQTAWGACEDAGFYLNRSDHYYPSSGDKSVGVFTGVFWSQYELFAAEMTERGQLVSLGTTPASIPNMVSYCMNFHGPSLAVDTMCSSSLTAIHLACESIRNGECQYAIAGGVNLVTHPHKYLFLKQVKFLANDGRCRSFGEGGDGYVPGEGVGAVLLTTLGIAKKEGYHIYGVIKGTALNHVGKTSGATVPDPVAQSEVVKDALKKAGIHPRTVGYVEAHGTGTSLGDPIEVQGLKIAFSQWTRDQQYCAIGSSKSNIGHLEAAAGIAGLTKLLLQFKYREIFPSLHSAKLNPYIPFHNTPFYVETALKEWQLPEIEIDGRKSVYPRRAGLSSFGANGSNAHIIVEEYISDDSGQPSVPFAVPKPFVHKNTIIVLSAKTEERLKASARNLLDAIRIRRFSDEDLPSIAYTLQVGREPMEERLGIIVDSLAELEEKLKGFIEDQRGISNLYRGQVKRNKESLASLAADDEIHEAIVKWVHRQKYEKLLDLWVKGLGFDWNKLYGDRKPGRISLPIYPFAKERYWVTEMKGWDLVVSSKTPAAEANPFLISGEPQVGTVMLAPVWDIIPADDVRAYSQSSPLISDQLLIVGGTQDNVNAIGQYCSKTRRLEIQPGDGMDEIAGKLETEEAIHHILWITPHDSCPFLTDDALIDGQNRGVLQVFRMVKTLLRMGYGSKKLDWSIITTQSQPIHANDGVNPTHTSLHGLAGSLAKEFPNWKIRLIDLESGEDWPVADIFNLPADPNGNSWIYRGREWYRQKLIPVQFPQVHRDKSLYKNGGVYVVIGGTGGIGAAWSEYIIRTYEARIIWIGRRPKDAVIQAKLDQLTASLGQAPDYISADATDPKALAQAYEMIKQQYSRIDGVIHAAIVLGDQSLANMEEQKFKAVLATKVDVSVRIAQVFGKEPLDFVMFFSSFQSFSKAAGQSNYAAGCTFKDAFAHQLSREWPCQVKVINWGYWGSVGVVASEEYQKRMDRAGLGSIEPPEAMEALETLLNGPLSQLVFLKITKPLAMEEINPAELIAIYPENLTSHMRNLPHRLPALLEAGFSGISGTNRAGLCNQVARSIAEIMLQLLQIQTSDIDFDVNIHEYGFNPLMFIELTARCNREFQLELPFSIFPGQGSLNRIAQYLVSQYPETFTRKFGQTGLAVTHPEVQTAAPGGRDKARSQPRLELEELLGRLLQVQLQSTGLFNEKAPGIQSGKTRVGLNKLYDRWLDESIAVLARQKLLQYDEKQGSVTGIALLDNNAVWQEWERKKAAWLGDPDLKAQVILVDKTLRALPEILTGKVPATDIIFPGSSMELVAGIYQNNMIADTFNQVLADFITAYVEERLSQDPSAQIRIIEIGAGTGGTSTMVFKNLQPYRGHILEYCYTDISKAFLIHAEKEYGAQNPFLTYQLFNVEAPVAGQSIDAGGFDIAIATNVLHATKNIRRTLRNTKALLKRNGLLILNEISGNNLFTHLTFGLLEGWWLYEDLGLRIPGCPGLHPETWQAVLEDEGFRSVIFPAQAYHDLGQQLIAAESDGVARQKVKVVVNEIAAKPEIKATMSQSSGKASLPYDPHPKKHTRPQKAISNGSALTDQRLTDYLREIIIEKLSESIKMDMKMIDVDAPFADFGLDSITGNYFIQTINQTWTIELKTTNLFDFSTVNQLAKHILANHKPAIVKRLEKNADPAIVEDNERSLDGEEMASGWPEPQDFPGGGVSPEPDIRVKEVESGGSIRKDGIAIIGMSGRFPGSKTCDELWGHLSGGKDLIEKVTRWDLARYFPEGTIYCNDGGFLEDIDRFDPLFFNISGLEATYMDPQQRVFLEESWKALEDAGYAGAGIEGRLCGVYVGYNNGDYRNLFANHPNLPAQAMWGNAASVIPARIAYHLNLQGPAITVDTACSSSLLAIHLACQGLWGHETELAIAGGVCIQCTPEFYLFANRGGMLSPTGRCHTFDEQADGFVPGEGVGVVVLKRLQEAITDGDHIYGVIRGSGINQDGATNGITAPSAKSQERLECLVYDSFGIDPGEIQMVEAHGTGTKLGDPIEFEALTRAFRKYTDKQEYCSLGSIKTNIGHTTAAAGVAGVIKILLSMQHKQIPPSLHFQMGNSHIQFKDSPFYVNTRLQDWNFGPGARRCAAVSSFGFSGTNAHMVIEEAPPREQQDRVKAARPGYLIVLSARTSYQLQQQAEQLVAYCEREPGVDCGNMSYTLILGRSHFNHRLAYIARNREELVDSLKKWLEKGATSQVYVSELRENKHREQPSLKKYGNQSIQNCRNNLNSGEYLEQLAVVADLYIQGYELEYEQLFAGEPYGRISLPTYPFAKDFYWVPEHDSGLQAGNQPPKLTPVPGNENLKNGDSLFHHAHETTQTPIHRLMFLPVWEEQPRLGISGHERPRKVLIVYSGNSNQLEETIKDYYQRNKITDHVTLIRVSGETRQLSDKEWLCGADDLRGFATCLSGDDSPDCFYFISGRTGEPAAGLETLAQSQQSNEIQLLRLIKVLSQKDTLRQPVDCYIITQDNYRIGDHRINPYGGGITGLAYAIAQGDYRFSVRNIDISLEDLATPSLREDLHQLILAEKATDRGDVVKLHNGCRYQQAFINIEPGRFTSESGIKPGGVYVILGGSGTVGGAITRQLIQKYHAKVIWIGRKPETSDFIHEKIRSLGLSDEPPCYIQADATNLEQMKEVVAKIKREYSVINGAIFSGLVFTFENSLKKTTESEFLEILNIKTKGSLNFYTAFQDEPLDFMCYFSSAQAFSFSGAANLSAYAAGITFSDTFIRYIRQSAGFPVGIINWGFWKSTMNEWMNEIPASNNIGALEDQEGADCFESFIRLFQGSVVNQVACLRTSKAVRELMKYKEEEIISVYDKHPDSIVQSLWNQAQIREHQASPPAKSASFEEFDEWLSKLLFIQLRQLGMFRPSDIPETAATMQKAAGIIEKYERWLKECLNILETKGLIQYAAGRASGAVAIENPELMDAETVWRQWDSIKESYLKDLELGPQVKLVEACLRQLPEILTGSQPATDVLFPDSSMEMVAEIYRGNAFADYFNHIVADTVAEYVKQKIEADSRAHAPQTKVRMIEVGAGTGSTSAMVFAKLKPYAAHLEYCYTDISKSFLLFAEEQYGPDNPYLVYKLWNVERPLADQGINAGYYDIIIATNVLHATQNIRQTLRNTKAALKTNGILLLNEVIRSSIFMTLTFGLLDGWWLYEDEPLRIPGSPLLAAETWQKVLSEEGFYRLQFLVQPESQPGQQVIFAASDGLVRQFAGRNMNQPVEKVTVDDIPVQPDQKIATPPEVRQNPTQPIRQTIKEVAPTAIGVSGQSSEEYVKNIIVNHLSNSIKIPQNNIDDHTAFSDYGVDSIIGVSFVKQVNYEFGVDMNSAILFDYTTVYRLTNYILKLYPEQIRKKINLSSGTPPPVTVDERMGSLFECQTPQVNNHNLEVTPVVADNHRFIQELERQFFRSDISTDSLLDLVSENIDGDINGK